MILGIDIGNTTISVAQLRPKSVRALLNVDVEESAGRIRAVLRKALQKDVEAVYICSVVPQKTTLVRKVIRKYTGARIFIVGKDVPVAIPNRYRPKRQVGQDRLVGAFAARQLYGAPVIIIDFGTAITFDVVNPKGEYEGGIILSGLKLSAESLFKKTALLPRVDRIAPPKALVGKTTRESILSGLFFGYGAMCRSLVADLERLYKGKPKVILTGGYTRVMQKYMGPRTYLINRNLVFEGLRLLVFKNPLDKN